MKSMHAVLQFYRILGSMPYATEMVFCYCDDISAPSLLPSKTIVHGEVCCRSFVFCAYPYVAQGTTLQNGSVMTGSPSGEFHLFSFVCLELVELTRFLRYQR